MKFATTSNVSQKQLYKVLKKVHLFFYVFTVSDSNVTRYVIENNKFLTSTDRPIRNANQPINVGLKLVITSILKVVCWLSFVYLFCTSNLFSLDRMNLMKEFSYEVMF